MHGAARGGASIIEKKCRSEDVMVEWCAGRGWAARKRELARAARRRVAVQIRVYEQERDRQVDQ